MRIRLRYLCVTLFSLSLLSIGARFLAAQSLTVRLDGDQLTILAPQLRLLTKEALDRLHDGASVSYVFQVAIASDQSGAPLEQMTYRFVISYDLWEEKYAVTRLEPSPRAISHLSASAAESWCLNSLTIRPGSFDADRLFWVSLDYHVEEPPKSGGVDNSSLTLSGLVDIFSRRSQKQQLRGSRQSGPFRLTDLRKSNPSRSGNR